MAGVLRDVIVDSVGAVRYRRAMPEDSCPSCRHAKTAYVAARGRTEVVLCGFEYPPVLGDSEYCECASAYHQAQLATV